MNCKKLFSASVISLAFVSCGSDDDGGGGGGVDADALAAELSSPSGEIADGDGAQGVGAAFGDVLSNQAGAAGQRRGGIDCSGAMSADYSCTCSGGGSFDVSVSGSQAAYEATFDYNACCISAADCCYNGSGSVAGTSDTGAEFTQCGSYDIDLECGGNSSSFQYSYCLGAGGVQWYLVTYESETFAVSGSYTEGVGGTWSVRDSNTTWNCVEDSTGAGCCSSADAESIIWDGGDALCPAVQ